MAAKPPKPPGNFLNQNNTNAKVAVTPPKTTTTTANRINSYNTNANSELVVNDETIINQCNENNVGIEINTRKVVFNTTAATKAKQTTATCNCTNISIMHLFHEMKQEFPTIPDPIVAQCVNENCHQRENCIQMLRNELALNPIPVQTYPAKVLHQQQLQQNQQQKQRQLQQQQQQQQQTQQKLQHQQSASGQQQGSVYQKPPKPLKPIRAAPVKPPVIATSTGTGVGGGLNSNANVTRKQSCDSVAELTNNINCNKLKDVENSNTIVTNNNNNKENSYSNNNNSNNSSSNCVDSGGAIKTTTAAAATTTTTAATNTSDMPATAANTTAITPALNSGSGSSSNSSSSSSSSDQSNQCQNELINNVVNGSPTQQQPPQYPPRARPTTLNLQTQQQQQQRQQLNIQLQQHLQQRNQQQQQQQLHHKPLRKAPLPPLPPKPMLLSQYSNTNNNINNSTSSHSQQSSFSNESSSSCLTSPISNSSGGESELSVNVSLSSPTTTAAAVAVAATTSAAAVIPSDNNYSDSSNQQLLKSPIRHRSVINVQPEPPYTRYCLSSPTTTTATSSTTTTSSGGGNSQKSFTSVNLTLRQPTSNSAGGAAVPQSTIDISAGPGLTGNGTGLTYSSTSYDARRGFQKNFHITVTDEGGVFSASRIRPRSSLYSAVNDNSGDNSGGGGSIDEHEENGGGLTAITDCIDNINPLRAAASEQDIQQQQYSPNQLQHQQQQQQQQQQQRVQYNNVANINNSNNNNNNMCLPRELDGFSQILERQKVRRDKLATALRDNKKRLNQLEQEINILTEPVSPGESERLDSEIQRLRCDCQAMLNQIENTRRYGSSVANSQANNSVNSRQQQQQQQYQQQQQPFPRPRQRPPPPRQQQPQLDFIQHHSSHSSGSGTTTPTTTTATALNSPNLQHQTLLQNLQQQTSTPPPTYQQYYQQYEQQQQPLTDDDEYSDSNTDGGEDEPLEMWACSMCTFRNHPQLNICECCENVRILPEPVLSREDIHITLSPGENRIIHSWIVS